jgi:PAS domain S-box-containing protein
LRQLQEARHELRILQLEHEQILHHDGHGIRIINRDFSIRFVNYALANIYGIKPEEAVGQKCYELFPSVFCHTPNCLLKRILSGEKYIQTEIERQKPSGVAVPCIVNASPFYSLGGKMAGIIETFTDITEKRHLEARIQESEERYKTLVQLGTEVGEAIVMLQDINGREAVQTFTSEKWSEITCYSPDELASMSFFDLINPTDRGAVISRYRQKMAGKSLPGLYEMTVIRKDGSSVLIESTDATTTYCGQKAGVLYLRDITERKNTSSLIIESEKKFKTLFEHLPIAVWELDLSIAKQHLDYLRSNGVIDLKEYIAKNPQDILVSNYGECFAIINANRAVLDLYETPNRYSSMMKVASMEYTWKRHIDFYNSIYEGKIQWEMETTVITKKGNTRFVIQRAAIPPGYEDTLSRVFITVYDITELREAESKLLEYQRTLEDAVNARTLELAQSNIQLTTEIQERIDFTRALVHELKTPITAMLNSCESLIGLPNDSITGSLARNIHRSTLRLSKRIDELLSLAKTELGILRIRKRLIKPIQVLQEVAKEMRLEVMRNSQSIVLDVPEKTSLVSADKERIKEVLANLISNASKYSYTTAPITAGVYEASDTVVFFVSDKGRAYPGSTTKGCFCPING